MGIYQPILYMTNQQDIERTLNFAEANIENDKTVRIFRDYMEMRFLIGYCKHEKLTWIKDHNLYLVRPESAKRKGGIDESNPMTYAVDYVLLYSNANQNKYRVYIAEGCVLHSQEEIAGLGYGEVEHKYIVYKLGKEVQFEDIDLKFLLKQEIEDNNPYSKPPIYLTGRTIFSSYKKDRSKKVGLVDADLLCNGTRHPNLVLLKIAGYLYDNNIPFELITNPNADTHQDHAAAGEIILELLDQIPNNVRKVYLYSIHIKREKPIYFGPALNHIGMPFVPSVKTDKNNTFSYRSFELSEEQQKRKTIMLNLMYDTYKEKDHRFQKCATHEYINSARLGKAYYIQRFIKQNEIFLVINRSKKC